MAKNIFVTFGLMVLAYVLCFIGLLIVNGVFASGVSDHDYGQSSTLSMLTLVSKFGLAAIVGVVAALRLPTIHAIFVSVGFLVAALVLGHLLPGGALLFSPYSDDLIGQQSAAVLLAAVTSWLVAHVKATGKRPRPGAA